MKPSEYRISASSIDEKMLMSKTRKEWVHECFVLTESLLEQLNLWKMNPDDKEKIQSTTKALQEKIDYINEVLERWYAYMCIRCGKLTPVDTYCGQIEECPHCLKDAVEQFLYTLSEEQLDAIEQSINASKGD